jgi:hypothetical protein
MSIYLILTFATVTIFVHFHPAGWLVYPLAVLPALPIIGMLAVIRLYLKEEKDEVVRTVFVETLLWAIGATLASTTVWGFLENFTHVPHLDLYMVFPIFWAFYALIAPFSSRRYR